METIETPRLILRQWTMADEQDMYDLGSNPLVGPNAGWKPHESMEETREILRAMFACENTEAWAIQRRDDGRCIGSIGLHKDSSRDVRLPVRMLGYVMNPRDWGNGFMHEGCVAALGYGFHKMGLQLISVYHFPANNRSRRVIEKLGFQPEGLRRMASLLYNGAPTDEYAYTMTAQEYDNRYKWQ